MDKNKKFAIANLIHASFATVVLLASLGVYIYILIFAYGLSGMFGGSKITIWEAFFYTFEALFIEVLYVAIPATIFSISTIVLSIIGIIKSKKLNYKAPYILFILSFFFTVIMYLIGSIFFLKNIKNEEKTPESLEISLNE